MVCQFLLISSDLIVVGIVGIAVTIISIIVTTISILQSASKNKHEKSNRPDQG